MLLSPPDAMERPPRPRPRLGLWLCLAGHLLSQASSTSLECSIMLDVEAAHEKCLERINLDNQTSDCKTKWDNLTCWPEANLGEVRVMPCPVYFIHFTGARGNLSRNCTSYGWSEMDPIQYMTACGYDPNSTLPGAENTFYSTVKTGYTIGYSLSLITLTVAMIVLCIFRKLHCTRNYIHMHLFMSFIMRAIAVFIKDILLFENDEQDHCSQGSVGCKAAMVFFQYCIMANFFWLLIEGLYLHTLLVVAFFSEKKYFRWYILIGWGVPTLFISAWTAARIKFENFGCWDLIESPYWWIIRAPILASILINVFFFICVIRILVQKLHTPDVGRNEASQYSMQHTPHWHGYTSTGKLVRIWPLGPSPFQLSNAGVATMQFRGKGTNIPIKQPVGKCLGNSPRSVVCIVCPTSMCYDTPVENWCSKFVNEALIGFMGGYAAVPVLQLRRLAKSTLLLIPLFGIHYIIFSFFPEDLRKEVMDIRIVFELVVGSFQGFIVAVLYCFLNGEVQAELKRKWRRWHMERFLGSDMKYHHPSLGSNGTSTQISMLTKCSPKSQRGSSFQADLSLV